MPRPRLTGLSAWGAQWEYVATNKDLATRVVRFLSDRRVLTEQHSREDFEECRQSADTIRNFLTLELLNVQGSGPLARSLEHMRTACRAFITAAGKNSEHFSRDPHYFNAALAAMREVFGRELGELEVTFGVELPDQLYDLVPQQDLSWLPNKD
ncbi:DUF6650 family protein [Serinicoccus kebangsaanensis]|uniref:DUF6650 family protein n=1 Tax=Serinicoccus kebangsaanensis TaxID=2602069 RepID=UPI00349F0508